MVLKKIIFIFAALLLTQMIYAENLYVTDRVLLGVHESANKDSTLIQSVPSGTSLKVLAEENGFKKVGLPDGVQGWVDAAFLVSEQPAPAQYDILLTKHKKAEKEIAALKDKLKKLEKEIQVRRDQVSNAKTAMQEMKKKFKKQPSVAVVDDKKLEQAEAEITKLQEKISEHEAEIKLQSEVAPEEVDILTTKKELDSLRLRIELAMRSLQGKELLSTKEKGNSPPSLPDWFWGVMLLFLIAGLAAGIAIMDYRNRKRHGGFRI